MLKTSGLYRMINLVDKTNISLIEFRDITIIVEDDIHYMNIHKNTPDIQMKLHNGKEYLNSKPHDMISS